MTSRASDWIAVTGLHAVDPEATTTMVPAAAMNDWRLSLVAKGLYAALLSYQGQPIDPFENAVEDDDDIASAIEELIANGYATRLTREGRM